MSVGSYLSRYEKKKSKTKGAAYLADAPFTAGGAETAVAKLF